MSDRTSVANVEHRVNVMPANALAANADKASAGMILKHISST